MSLPRHKRLTHRCDFLAVREHGRSWTGRHMILAVLPRPDQEGMLAGFTASKRAGKAVTRNFIRRRLRMIVQEAFPHFPESTGGFVITIARHSASTASYAELRREWRKLARRAGLLPQDFTTG